MKIYIVSSAFQGCISDVKAFMNPKDARMEKLRLYRDIGIEMGHEEESQSSVAIHEVELN
jgi:hypothetical protein